MKKHILNYSLAASLICGDIMHLKKDLMALEKARIDYIHFDVMDGIFVPRYGMFPEMITQIRHVSSVPINLHMMTENAESYIQTFIAAGLQKKDDIFTFHVESTQHIHRVVKKIHEKGIKAGVALNPGTPLAVLDYILDEIDLITLMAINPGIVGHTFIPSTIKKIASLKKKLPKKSNTIIEIDGGVTFENAPKIIQAGATMLVCGSKTIFNQTKSLDVLTKLLRETITKTEGTF